MTSVISVIIPCYNQGNYLDTTLKSVFDQTFPDWECLIIDDGSTDKTKIVAKNWCNKDSRFSYFFKINGGLSSARNCGLRKANGKYIQFLDSDDIIKPDKFISQIKDLREAQVSVCDYFSFIDGTETHAPHRYLSPFLSESNYKIEIIKDWEYRKSIPCHSILFEHSLVKKHNLYFREDLPNHEDWVFWVQLFFYSKRLKNNYNVLALYRIHNRAMSSDFKLMRFGFLKAAKILGVFF